MARRRGRKSWQYLTEELRPDIALLQEVLPQPPLFAYDTFLHRTIGGYRRWGSALLTSGLPVRELDVGSYQGWVVAGEIRLPGTVLDKDGNFATPFNTAGMYRGHIGPDGKAVVEIYRD